MRFLVTSWLVAAVMIGASGCDAPQDGPEAPPAQDPADQPAPTDPEGWDQQQGAASDVGAEPAGVTEYEVLPAEHTDQFGDSQISERPVPADPVERPAFGEPHGWNQRDEGMSGGGSHPGELGEPDLDIKDEEPAYSSPDLSAEIVGDN
jgi:hypothetical protein